MTEVCSICGKEIIEGWVDERNEKIYCSEECKYEFLNYDEIEELEEEDELFFEDFNDGL